MLKHDSSEETKTYSADSYEKKEVCRTRKEQRIKEGLSISRRKLFTNHNENKLVYTYVPKTFKKIFIR
jgi:hypothetical protein